MSANVIDATGGAFGDEAPAAISNNGSTVQSKVSFDELLDMYEPTQTPAVDDETKEGLAEAKERIKEEKELDSRTEPSVGKEQGLLNEAAQKAKEEEKQEKEALKDAVDQQENVVRAKVGDSEITVPQDAVFTTTVNGKSVEFKLTDALTAFETKEEFERNANARVSKLKNMEQKFINQVSVVNNNLESIADAAAQGDMMGAIKLIAEMQQKDPIVLEKEILDNLNRVFDAYTKMSPIERDAYFAKRQNEYYKEKIEKQQKLAQQEQENHRIEAEVVNVCQKLGLSKEEFFGVYELLAQQEVGQGRTFRSQEDITPVDVAAFVLQRAHHARVQDAIQAIVPDRVKDTAFRNYVIEMTAGDPTFSTVDDIADLIKTALNLPSPAVQNLSNKVLKDPVIKNQVTQGSSKAKTKVNESELEEFFFSRRT